MERGKRRPVRYEAATLLSHVTGFSVTSLPAWVGPLPPARPMGSRANACCGPVVRMQRPAGNSAPGHGLASRCGGKWNSSGQRP